MAEASLVLYTLESSWLLLVSFDRAPTSWNHKLKSIQGIYPAFPGNVTWISVNLAGDYKRAAGMAIYIGIGNLAGGKVP